MIFRCGKRLHLIVILLAASLMLSGCSGAGRENGDANNGGVQGDDGSRAVENLVRCPLSGDMVPSDTVDRRPVAVMIENAPAARPQSGLDKADVVYEILAEGAITRFLAVYLHGDAGEVGPVRSARPYYIERMFEYNAMYAYCGGSPAAKEMVRTEGVASLDEFGVGRQAYWRAKGRSAPHNLYADTVKLRAAGAKRGYEKSVKLPEFTFLAEGEENPGGITSESVVINYPKSFNLVRWDYDPERNLYSRSQGGAAHRDAVTGRRLAAGNIMVQYANTKVIDPEGRRDVSMVGRGRAVMFTGGKAYSGSWSKEKPRAQTYFYGEDGDVFRLNPGQTWIEVVPRNTRVEY